MSAQAQEIDLDASIVRLKDTALRIKAERDELRAVVQDLALGADMMLQVATGSFASYAKEVRKVARAALGMQP